MADRARLMEALKNADAAGDQEAAARIAQMIRDIDTQPQQQQPDNRSFLQKVNDTYQEGHRQLAQTRENYSKLGPVEGPLTFAGDFARSGVNSLGFGLPDYLTDLGTSGESHDATAESRKRLEGYDFAAQGIGGIASPGVAGKVLTEAKGVVPVLKRAFGYGTEAAGQQMLENATEGKDLTEGVGVTSALGGGGSVLGDVGGKVVSKVAADQAQTYRTDADLLNARDTSLTATGRKGKKYTDLDERAQRVELARKAQEGGAKGFKRMLEGIDKPTSYAEAGFSQSERAKVADLAAGKPGKINSTLNWLGDAAQKAQMNAVLNQLTGGTMGLAKEGLRRGAKMFPKVTNSIDKGLAEALAEQIRDPQGVGKRIDPRVVQNLRDLLARMGSSSGRTSE